MILNTKVFYKIWYGVHEDINLAIKSDVGNDPHDRIINELYWPVGMTIDIKQALRERLENEIQKS